MRLREGITDRRTDGRTDGQTDTPSYRDATACFFSTETKDDVVFQSPDQTETCTMIFLKGLGLAFMFTSVEIFPIQVE